MSSKSYAGTTSFRKSGVHSSTNLQFSKGLAAFCPRLVMLDASSANLQSDGDLRKILLKSAKLVSYL